MKSLKEMRALAKESGINSFGKGVSELEVELANAGVLEGVTKTGRKSWKPGNRFDLINKEPGFRHRMALNDPALIRKRQAEGWEIVNSVTSPETKHVKPGEIDDGAELGPVGYREHIAMRLPEEIGQARDEYHREKVQKRRQGLKTMVRKQLAKAAEETGSHMAPVHGDGITIIR